MHGPVSPDFMALANGEAALSSARMLSQMNQTQLATEQRHVSNPVENAHTESAPTSDQMQRQFELVSHPAVKILVKHEGWLRNRSS
jgi:hypothetical protein